MNREIYPVSLFPIVGDVTSTIGNNSTTVQAIQGVSIDVTNLLGGEVLTYNPNTAKWTPTLPPGIYINNVSISNDYGVAINTVKQVLINGA